MTNARQRLSPIERRFVDEFLIDQNPRQAAIRAGYSLRTSQTMARKLLLNPVIRQAIQDEMAKRSERTLVTADTVLFGIQSVVRRCMQQEAIIDKRSGKPIMVKTDDGTLAPAYKFDAQGALKGLELLGKHLKLFADQLDVSGVITHEVSVKENLKALSLDEVKALAGINGEPGARVIEGETVAPEVEH